jgi:hypothetical protein
VGDYFYLSGAKFIMGHFLGFLEEAPSKNPSKCPIICFARKKKNILLHFQNQIRSYNWKYLCAVKRNSGRNLSFIDVSNDKISRTSPFNLRNSIRVVRRSV